MTIPSKISEQEKLGRGIFSKNTAKRAPRRILHRVFLEKKGKKSISVDRLDVTPTVNELVEIADKRAVNRQRSFYGWAVITAKKASLNGRRVLPSPRQDNPYHADINLPDAAVKDEEEQKIHAQQLADDATWYERPYLTSELNP